MKKRIISLILVVVMSVLTLAGCAYSYTGDDMTKYATFNKDAFLAALAEFEIEDGDFTEDAATREQKVLDTIMASLAKKVNTDDKKSEGIVGTNDLFYYCYYVTATIKDVEYTFFTDKMKESAAVSVQLGLGSYSTDLAEKIAEAFEGYEFTEGSAYKQVTDGKVTAGQIVYVSYTRTFDKTNAEGKVEEVKEIAKSNRVVLDETNPLHKHLIDKATIGTKISTLEMTDEAVKGTYTNLVIDWAEEGAGRTVTDVTYTEDTNESATVYVGSEKQNLKDVELTYHVYPVSYAEVADITVESIINDIYGKNVTLANLATILFGKAYSEHEHSEDEEDDTAHKLLEKYKFTVEGEEISLEDFATKLKSAQTKVEDTKKAMEAAKKDYDKDTEALKKAEETFAEKTTALEKAEAAYAAEATDANKKAVDDAKAALKTATDKLEAAQDDVEEAKKAYLGSEATDTEKAEVGAKKEYEDAVAERDKLVTEFSDTVEGGADAVVKGYKENVVYADLENKYDADIKDKVATYVYEQMTKSVNVTSYPKKAVKSAYKYLIDSYEYCFYENYKLDGTNNSSAAQSYYKQYGGSFKNFLVAEVVNKHYVKEYGQAEVKTYDEAVAAVNKIAEAHVAEAIIINIVAETFDLKLSKKEFKELTKDDYTYDYYVDSYYEDNFEIMYQFNKLMDALLESEETEEGIATLVSYDNDYIGTVKRVEELTVETETE